jgi:hypothetical protein
MKMLSLSGVNADNGFVVSSGPAFSMLSQLLGMTIEESRARSPTGSALKIELTIVCTQGLSLALHAERFRASRVLRADWMTESTLLGILGLFLKTETNIPSHICGTIWGYQSWT